MIDEGPAPEQSANTPPCPCCDRAEWMPRWKGFVVCRSCGLMAVNQSVPAEELKKFYQEDYFKGREYVDYVADKPAQQKTLRNHLRVVRRHARPGGRLLEIGCAYGFFLELVQKDYPGSVGVDVSSAGVAYARAHGLDAREGDLLGLSFADKFDGVCLWDTIEHLPNPREIIQKSSELLKPGGHLFLSTGDFGALLPRLQGLNWRQIHPPTHLFYFTRQSFRELCPRVGLEVVRFGTVTVHRRLGSVLQALANFHGRSAAGRSASLLQRVAPRGLLNWNFPLNLGDTLCLVARKRQG
jgi:SAM-dependent methyltransferase